MRVSTEEGITGAPSSGQGLAPSAALAAGDSGGNRDDGARGEGRSEGGRFGTFSGVFTPSILTILGVVMYMLVGRNTGEAGLGGMLLVVLVAHSISISTGLSVAAIATNRTVGAGGAYFMISRSLGAPAGAAIGIPLFFAQALSVTFYIVGFTGALMPLIPADWQGTISPLMVSTTVNVLLTLLSLKSAELAIKAQYVVMAAIVLSLVSFFTGTTEEFPRAIEWFNEDGESFGTVFAIFFPAVTGIMAGVGMSGDLKDPRISLPKGTLAAILVGMVVYLAFPIWLSLNFSNDALIHDTEAVWTVSRWPQLIYLGVWGATLSSALGSILTAPRTLQALGSDGLVPRILAKGSSPNNEPRIGTMLTFALAQAGIFLGSLDAIAPVLTMFFLATYGFTNLACGLEKWAEDPAYRPSFKTPAFVSLAGAAGCFYVMSIIDLPAMAAAMVFCALIFFIAERRDLGTTWGDSRHGIWSALVRFALQRLRRAEYHPQNWRPNLVIAGGDPNKRPHLLHMGNAIVQNRGIVTYFHLLRGRVAELAERRKALFAAFDEKMAEYFPNVFYRVDIVDDVYEGAVQVAQSYGMGNFESNAVLAGWPKKADRLEAYLHMCRDLVHLDRSVLLMDYDSRNGFGKHRSIQVWWGGLEGNGGLMLLLAFLIRAHVQWRGAEVSVLTVVSDESERDSTLSTLEDVLEAARLEATPKVIVRGDRSIADIMAGESADADLAIVGFRLPSAGASVQDFYERMSRMLGALPTTLLVLSARSFESEPVLFDDKSEEVGRTSLVPGETKPPPRELQDEVSSPALNPSGQPLFEVLQREAAQNASRGEATQGDAAPDATGPDATTPFETWSQETGFGDVTASDVAAARAKAKDDDETS